MRFSLQWLKEWIDIDCEPKELMSKLAMAGFETEGLTKICDEFSGVISAKIVEAKIIQEHPILIHYQLNISKNKLVNVISKFSDLSIGTNVAFAPNGIQLKNFTVDCADEFNIAINGIICTEADLGFSENDTLVTLDSSISTGCEIYQELELDDQILEIDVTPNRGDCLSVKGMTRELGAIFGQDLHVPDIMNKAIQHHADTYNAEIHVADACPHFNTRIIYDIDNTIIIPTQFKERLRRSGIRSINAIVDIINYTMFEIGQPMHAYDLEKISGDIQVRYANKNESLILLDGEQVELSEDTLVIADNTGAIGIAGVMGGQSTSVTRDTRSVILESAYFNSEIIIGKARQYGLTTDSSFRFERGVCPLLQVEALDRASYLITDICGGKVGHVHEVSSVEYLPQPKLIKFRQSRCQQILGIEISLSKIRDIFTRLGFTIMENAGDLDIRVPSYRFDLNLEIDLIEEVARLYGYDKIIAAPVPRLSRKSTISFNHSMKFAIRHLMMSHGFNEAITYSFVDPSMQVKLFKEEPTLNLLNPISPQLSQMRLSILPGLLQALMYNQHRQCTRIKLFELGQCFIFDEEKGLQHISKVAGVAFGTVMLEQWGVVSKQIDFFDIKKDVENLLAYFDNLDEFKFKPTEKNFLHPGQSAKISYKEQEIGYIGMLHPNISLEFDLKGEIFVFELIIEKLPKPHPTKYKNLSIYPELRRDISFFVKKEVLAYKIIEEIKRLPCSFLKKVSIFDIYEDPKRSSEKSIALGLILRDNQRTLVDDEVDAYLSQVIGELQKKFKIELRNEKL